LFSCKKEDEVNRGGTFASTQVDVYHGKAWSSVKLNKEGDPEQLTLTLDDQALNTVFVGDGTPGHNHDNNIIVPLHARAKETTPFQFIMLNWNPNGHEPDHIYTLPHFDMHFYMTSQTEVMNYVDPTKLDNAPNPAYLPATYISPAPAVPMMGRHWVDVTSGEFNGQPFTETFLYGSYDGKVVFYEPMITLDFLKTQSNFQRTIPQPSKFAKTGWYPTKMKVVKHDGVTDIVLDGFVKQKAS
jgi:hypothetical protein